MKNKQTKQSVLQTMVMVCAFILVLVSAIALILSIPKLEPVLIGEDQITLEYGTAYQEPGVQALFDGKPVKAQITIDQPQMQKLGTYTICYTLTYGHQKVTAQRTVHVVDSTPPNIELVHIPGYLTDPNLAYVEEGYKAFDNLDGDLTAKVQRTVQGDTVHYTVSDSSGNTTTVSRKINYIDKIPPLITLLGESTISITAGTEFTEPGFTAADQVSGDVTHSVTVSGGYDPYLPGTYTIVYQATDASGNTAKAYRTVIVEPIVQQEPIEIPDKVIYLTFDDGPSQYTPELLAILSKYNVKATFFVVGTSELEYLDDIAEGGHAIGIHTNTHVFQDIYASEKAFFNDFYAIYQKIFDHTGIETKISRFPGGSSNSISKKICKGIMTKLAAAVESRGFAYYDWNVDSNDAGGATTAEEVFQNVIAGVNGKKHAVVLQHDTKLFSIQAVEKIIQWGLANGYVFLPLDENGPVVHHTIRN